MIPLNIEDLRFLLSALIQILPTILSITLIALFAFPELTRSVREKFRTCIILSALMILIFFLAITSDITVLMGLEHFFENDKSMVLIAIGTSGLAIIYLYCFMIWIFYQFLKRSRG
jgi:hypothetical protein